MFYRLKLTVAAGSVLLVPGIALAQAQAQSEINVSANVLKACGLGTPDQTFLDLGDLTGPDGKLASSKTGSAVLASTTIANAWCNAPHSVKMQAVPMLLQGTKPYGQPVYMTRAITYDATLQGWPAELVRRPRTGDDDVQINFAGAYAPAGGLVLKVARLNSLTANRAEQTGLMLEAGTYKGTVTITLATVN